MLLLYLYHSHFALHELRNSETERELECVTDEVKKINM